MYQHGWIQKPDNKQKKQITEYKIQTQAKPNGVVFRDIHVDGKIYMGNPGMN